jgi:hypothetical protein
VFEVGAHHLDPALLFTLVVEAAWDGSRRDIPVRQAGRRGLQIRRCQAGVRSAGMGALARLEHGLAAHGIKPR